MSSDPNILVFLTSAKTEFEGRAMAAALEAEGIPARVFAAAARMVQWEAGYNDPIKVMVRRGDLARAADVLRQTRAASRSIDWSTVDVDEPGVLADGAMCDSCGGSLAELPAETEECPHCGAWLRPDDAETGPVSEGTRVPFSVRWAGLRSAGLTMVMLSGALWALGGAYAVPLAAIVLFYLAFRTGPKGRSHPGR